MNEVWKKQAVALGKTIHGLAGKHQELKPLETSFINFARKYRLEADVVIDGQNYEKLIKTIARQNEEIEALELRIKRLTEGD